VTPATPVRFAIPVRGVTNFGNATSVAISRDGRTTVFSANSPTGRQLHVRTLGEVEIRVLEGTEDAYAAAISPDGRSVAFLAETGIRRIAIEGGPVSSVFDAPGLLDLSWLDDETLIAQRELGFDDTGLLAVPASGGSPRSVTRVDSAMRELLQHRPRVVLGGTKILYVSVAGSGLSNTKLAIADVATGKLQELGLTGVMGLGFIDDQLIYVREDGSIMAAPMDMKAMRVRGPGIVVAPSAFVQPGFAAAALSEEGTLVYIQASSASRLILAEAGGGVRTLLEEPRRYAHPRFSPDGSRLVVDVVGRPTLDLWSLDLKAGTFQRLTTDGNNDRPEWSPDGSRIVYLSDREMKDGQFLAWSIAADGSGSPERLFDWPNPVREVLYTPDGGTLIFREDHSTQRRNVLRLALGAGAKPEPILSSPFDELMPRVSPDGRWLAYVSDESGRREVYVRAFPGGGGKQQVSEGGAAEPLWSPDGAALFYRSGDRLVRASLGVNGASLAVTGRDVVLEGSYEANIYHPNWDVSPDGRRFVLLKPADEGSQLVTVVHFDEELRRRMTRR
jgi:Tol biopolymer transport system component